MTNIVDGNNKIYYKGHYQLSDPFLISFLKVFSNFVLSYRNAKLIFLGISSNDTVANVSLFCYSRYH